MYTLFINARIARVLPFFLTLALGGCLAPGGAPGGAPATVAMQPGTGSVEHSVAPSESVLAFDQLPSMRPDVRVKNRSAEQFDAALAALGAKDYAAAEQLLLGVTRAQPELSGPWLNLGQVYLEQGRTQEAQSAFERAIVANPANCAAYNQLGILARQAGRLKDAERSYLACIERDPSFPEVHLNLGILYELYLGRLPQALAEYRSYQQLASSDDTRVKGWVMDLERRL